MADDDAKDSDPDRASSDDRTDRPSRPVAEEDEGHVLELRRVGNSVRHYTPQGVLALESVMRVHFPPS
jgi:hypothetical protein